VPSTSCRAQYYRQAEFALGDGRHHVGEVGLVNALPGPDDQRVRQVVVTAVPQRPDEAADRADRVLGRKSRKPVTYQDDLSDSSIPVHFTLVSPCRWLPGGTGRT
jgi:hypothetical protein